MTSVRPRDKARTRERIAQEATRLFLQRGFEAVTVTEIAAAAGVSRVTVFTHFPRKEDLLLDRGPEAIDLLVTAVRNRGVHVGVVQAVHRLADQLADERHPLSGLTADGAPFLRVVLDSRALQSRAREWEGELVRALTDALSADPRPVRDPELLAALILAVLRTSIVSSARRVLAGDPISDIASDHARRLATAFPLLETAEAALT